MMFTGAYFSIEPTAKLAKKNISLLNRIIGTTFRMDKYSYKTLLEIIAEDGAELAEVRVFSKGTRYPFEVIDVRQDGKLIGSIFLNFRNEEVAASV